MKSVKYLDAVIAKKGLKNDKALCDYMGWSHSVASHYRTGKRVMDNETCLRLASELDLDNPLPIIIAADIDRAEKSGQKSLWEVFTPKMAGLSAALVFAIVTNFVTPSPAQAAPLQQIGGATVYLMSNQKHEHPR
ncbi:Cro/Cl family transcriptional regulator [Paraburkholderia sp. SOS3]|uniref:Cro/Cl family transcriptional regulator n=1 Tax=Paraburkholderia sp. SOS3 TaxID=1926494 RepID=UPI0009478100|nr:Cro/Cl family transcriptional regulator [Paraburkholderia sp. SOS3]APR39381.1 Cro/Cl family transcriptional regulator [Paraburkholderia sp. SOS3]